MGRWVAAYFEEHRYDERVLPLFLQHQGHSRTIVGYERHQDDSLALLLLDPSADAQALRSKLDVSATVTAAVTSMRRGFGSGKGQLGARRDYQLVCVARQEAPLTDSEWLDAKLLQRSLPLILA